MATLFNTKISATYEGLLKTVDNAAISATLRELSDGSGNQTGLYLNTAGDFKVTSVLEWGSLKDTGTGVTITRYVTSTDGLENFDNNTSLPTSAAVKLYVDTKFATSDTLQEVLSFGNTTSGNDIVVSANDDITFTDSSKALFGNGQDLEINHNGTDSFVTDLGTGDLRLRSDNSIKIQASTGGNNLAAFTKGAGVDLYFNNAKKLETTNTGISVTGIISNLTNPIAAQDAATKSYVDALDAGSDLDITDGTTTGDVNLNTQTLSILGTTNEIETVVSGQGVTIGLPSSISTDLVGNVTGNVTGNVAGDLTGNVTSTSVLANGVTATTQASTDSSTKVATTAYVKGLDNASDLDFSGDSGTGDVNLNAQTFAITGTANQIESSASNQGLSLQFPSAGVTLPNGSLATTQSSGDNSTKVATTSYVDTSAALYLPLAGGTMSGNTIHNDSIKSIYGTGSDAQVYHDGSNFYANNSTGQLNIDQSAVTESIVFKTSDANALDTTALIINRGGDLITGRDVTIAGDLTVNGTTTTVNSQTLSVDDPLISLAINNDANSLDIGYYGKYNDGTTRYLGLFNDSSDSNKFKLFKGTTVEPTTTVNIGAAGYAAADLELANLVATGNINLADNGKAIFGTGNDLQIYHDGSNSYIAESGTGGLKIQARDSIVLEDGTSGENYIYMARNGKVELYYDGSAKFETTSTGVSVTGDGTFSGSVTVNGNGIDIDNNDDVRLRFDNASVFKAGLQVATTAGDMIAGSAINDFCIRANENMLFAAGGNIESMRIDSSGNATFAGDVIIQGATPKISIIDTDAGDSFSINNFTGNFVIKNDTDNVDPLVINGAGNATFAGDVTAQGATFTDDVTIDNSSPELYLTPDSSKYSWMIAAQENVDQHFEITPSTTVGGTTFSTPALKISGVNSNATFAGETYFNKGVRFYRYTDQANFWSVYTNTDDSLRFNYNGAGNDEITIDTSGNVGIGTTSPTQAKLVIDSDTAPQILVKNSSGANSQILFEDNDGLTQSADITFDQSGNNSLTIKTNYAGSNLLLQPTSGNVGIGTATPMEKLDTPNIVIGGTNITGTTRANSLLIDNLSGTSRFYSTGAGSTTYGSYQWNIASSDASLNTTVMVIDSNGNVGIGTDSPSAKLEVKDSENNNANLLTLYRPNSSTAAASKLDFSFNTLNGTQAVYSRIQSDVDGNANSAQSGSLSFWTPSSGTLSEKMRIESDGQVSLRTAGAHLMFQNTAGAAPYIANAGTGYADLTIATGGTERMRITSGGDVNINQTASKGKLTVSSDDDRYQANIGLKSKIASGDRHYLLSFFKSNDSIVGYISHNDTSTSYVTSSDYRLKEDLQDFAGLDKVSKIPVYDYKWKSNESRSYGVMAHELQEVLPDAVTGEKDAEEMQGVDYSKIVPLLIKSIQELKAEIDILKAK